MVAGIEAGFNLPLGDSFFIGVGGMWIPIDASFDANDNENNADVTLTSSDHFTYYIQPSISVYDNSAIYLKIGVSEAARETISPDKHLNRPPQRIGSVVHIFHR